MDKWRWIRTFTRRRSSCARSRRWCRTSLSTMPHNTCPSPSWAGPPCSWRRPPARPRSCMRMRPTGGCHSGTPVGAFGVSCKRAGICGATRRACTFGSAGAETLTIEQAVPAVAVSAALTRWAELELYLQAFGKRLALARDNQDPANVWAVPPASAFLKILPGVLVDDAWALRADLTP